MNHSVREATARDDVGFSRMARRVARGRGGHRRRHHQGHHGVAARQRRHQSGAVGGQPHRAGTTGHAAGNLYAPIDAHPPALADKWDVDIMATVAQSRQNAIDLIERTSIPTISPAGSARRPLCLFSIDADPVHVAVVERKYCYGTTAVTARDTQRPPG